MISAAPQFPVSCKSAKDCQEMIHFEKRCRTFPGDFIMADILKTIAFIVH